jgi:8-amino-7-oxononanoate synthase
MKDSGTIGIPDPRKSILTTGFKSPIVPVLTKAGKAYNLRAWLLREGFSTWGLAYPIVPKGEDRVRVVIHADNSDSQIERFVDAIMQWALDQENCKNLEHLS